MLSVLKLHLQLLHPKIQIAACIQGLGNIQMCVIKRHERQVDTEMHGTANVPSSLISLKTLPLKQETKPIWEAWENDFVFHVMREE